MIDDDDNDGSAPSSCKVGTHPTDPPTRPQDCFNKRYKTLVGRRFAHQCFADSRDSFATKTVFLKHLARFARIGSSSSLRFALKRAHDSHPILAAIHFLEGRFAKQRFFRSENRFARIGPLRLRTKGRIPADSFFLSFFLSFSLSLSLYLVLKK